MTDPVERLLAHPAARPGQPATEDRLRRLAARVGAELPQPLVRLWRTAGRVRFGFRSLDCELLGPEQIVELLAPAHADAHFGGCVPLLDDHQSNYVVLPPAPVAPRVAWYPHDAEFRLLYRTVEGFLHALADAADGDRRAAEVFHDIMGDYPPAGPRDAADRQLARELLAAGGPTNQRLAVQLLAADDGHAWAGLLEAESDVRREARDRLRRIDTPAVRGLLDRDAAEFEAFAAVVAAVAAAAGLAVGERRGEVLQVGGCWYDLETFFHRRHVPDALPRLVAWVRDQLAGRHPRDRPGHYFADD